MGLGGRPTLNLLPMNTANKSASPEATPSDPSAAFASIRLNAAKLWVLLVLVLSTFACLYWAPQLDAVWGAGAAYRYAASGLPVLYVVLVVAYLLYLRLHPEKDVQ